MPLVVPGIMTNDGNKTNLWQNQLLGKKLGDQSDETTFAKKDLPKEHRVVEKESFLSMDHKPDRLNIHVDDDGTVTKITHG